MTKRLLGVIVAGLAAATMTATPSFASTAQYSISDAKWDQVSYGSKPSLAQKKQADIVRVTYGRGPGPGTDTDA